MSIADRLEGKRVVICAGSGGVGKTTTSAALAMGLAAAGAKVAVVTIDPAKRLADSLGLEDLDNEPRLVDPSRFKGHGIEMQGELWAMMLDAKRTFDELIDRLAPDEKARDEILANRIYQELSSAVAGSQEFTAIAKLYELDRSRRVRRPRARHAAVAQRAGLPRRARPADRLPRGPRAQGLPRADRDRGEGHGPRDERRVRRAAPGHRRRPAAGPQRLLPRARRPDRRLPRAGQRRQEAARRPGDDVPHRHLTRARAGRGGDLLPRQAAPTPACRSAAWSSTACSSTWSTATPARPPPRSDGDLDDELRAKVAETLRGAAGPRRAATARA